MDLGVFSDRFFRVRRLVVFLHGLPELDVGHTRFRIAGSAFAPKDSRTQGADSSFGQGASPFATGRRLFSTGQTRSGRVVLPGGARARSRGHRHARASGTNVFAQKTICGGEDPARTSVRREPNPRLRAYHDGICRNSGGAE